MVVGDFGQSHDTGFGDCYSKTVDKPCHFRAKPKHLSAGASHQQSSKEVGEGSFRPDYVSQRRYACRAEDHADLLRRGGQGSVYNARMSVKVKQTLPTSIVRNHEIGGTRDRPYEAPVRVGKKQLPESNNPCVANIADPSAMPGAAPMQRKKDADFSALRHPSMFSKEKSKFVQPPKGKKQDASRSAGTAGFLQWAAPPAEASTSS